MRTSHDRRTDTPLLPHLMALLESARREIVISCPEAIMALFDTDDAISEMLRVARRAPTNRPQSLVATV